MAHFNFYEVLGIQRSETKLYTELSPSDIKQAYHAALLEHHPDKQRQTSSIATSNTLIPVIKSAYAVLSDPVQRAAYNCKLLAGDGGLGPPKATGIVDLSEMHFDEEHPQHARWTRPCRCGQDEGYVLTEDNLEQNGSATSIIVQCVGCSLWIEVQYDIEE